MKGQAFLSLVILIGAIVALVGITLAVIVSSFIETGYGYRASVTAQSVANSGAEDAVLHLDRGDIASFPDSYTLTVGSNTASVAIAQNSPSTGYYTIVSSSTVSQRTSKITVVAAVNASTTQVSVVSWQTTQ